VTPNKISSHSVE